MALDNEDPNDDIAGDIRAAMATLKDEAPATAAEIETPVVEATSEPVAERDDGRDDKGRFKAKDQPTQAAAEPVSKTASVQGAEAAATGTEPVAPPAKWDPEAKAAFMAAPREVQKQLLAHAEATEKANADWQPKAQTFAMIEQVIAPQREAWARSGMTEAQAIAGLVQAQQMLDQDPISGLVQIAKSYGLTRADWLAAAGIGPEGETEPAAPVQDPRYDALMQEVRSLKGTLTQAEQSKQQQAQADIQKMIDEFARDPKHLYFAMSSGGVHETHDGGRSWAPLVKGMEVVEGFDAANIAFHDPHCVRLCPSNPDRLYQQNHCGIYRLDRPGREWVRIGRAMPAAVGDIGFPMVVHPRDDKTVWVFPMDGQTVWPRTSAASART